MTSTTQLVPFHNHTVEATRDDRGEVWAVLRKLCDNLGIDTDSQRKRLADTDRSPWATTAMMTVVAADRKEREVFCLHMESVPMWLATIAAGRVKPEARGTLVLYQKECAKVLRDHFFGQRTVDPVETRLAVLERRVDAMVQRRAVSSGPRLAAGADGLIRGWEELAGERLMSASEALDRLARRSGAAWTHPAPLLRAALRRVFGDEAPSPDQLGHALRACLDERDDGLGLAYGRTGRVRGWRVVRSN